MSMYPARNEAHPADTLHEEWRGNRWAQLGSVDPHHTTSHAEFALTRCSQVALAETVGVHPATMTGIVDRLGEIGWIARERSTEDRRNVHLRVLCAELDLEQLETVASFLEAVGAAARDAASEIADVARG